MLGVGLARRAAVFVATTIMVDGVPIVRSMGQLIFQLDHQNGATFFPEESGQMLRQFGEVALNQVQVGWVIATLLHWHAVNPDG